MPRLVVNYMRPVAVLLLILVTAIIVYSFFFIPKVLVVSLPYFYHQFWHSLTLLFIIATLFLGLAFFIEQRLLNSKWCGHVIAVLLLGWFIEELVLLIKTSNIFLAFIG